MSQIKENVDLDLLRKKRKSKFDILDLRHKEEQNLNNKDIQTAEKTIINVDDDNKTAGLNLDTLPAGIIATMVLNQNKKVIKCINYFRTKNLITHTDLIILWIYQMSQQYHSMNL
jgi:hypothetical protein